MSETQELRPGDAVTSPFFKGTGVFVGYATVEGKEGQAQTLLEVRAPEEEFSLLIRERELEKADVS
jgi:hypothetical protein